MIILKGRDHIYVFPKDQLPILRFYLDGTGEDCAVMTEINNSIRPLWKGEGISEKGCRAVLDLIYIELSKKGDNINIDLNKLIKKVKINEGIK